MVLFNSPTAAATLNVPLTVTGLVTASNFTTAGAVTTGTISASGLIATSGANINITGSTNPSFGLRATGNDWGYATSAGAFSSSSVIGDSVIRATGSLHLLSGIGAAAITINTSNNVLVRNNLDVVGTALVSGALGVSGFIAGTPRYRSATRTNNQTIPFVSAAVVNWTDQSTTGNISTFLSSSAGRYTNASGGILRVLVTYMISWDGTILSELLRASILKNGTFHYGQSRIPTNPTINWASQTMTSVVDMANGDYFEIQVFNSTTSPLDIIGSTYGSSAMQSQLTMYILN